MLERYASARTECHMKNESNAWQITFVNRHNYVGMPFKRTPTVSSKKATRNGVPWEAMFP